jgi:hypothetical protein
MMPKDLDQSAKMLKMRVKIDIWTQGHDENFRENVRENLHEDGFRRLQQTRRLAFGSSGTYNVISLFYNDDQFSP